MNINKAIKSNAIKLRLDGYTYSEINLKLARRIPKSTLSDWFNDLKFTKNQKINLIKNVKNKIEMSQKIGAKIIRQSKIDRLRILKNKNTYMLPLINKDIQKIMLSILYLGEGSKSKGSDTMTLGSANPRIIQLYITLLNNCFDADASKFRARIQCRADQNTKELEKYWHKVTKIPLKQFYPTYIDKRTIGKPTQKMGYKGVCAITYFNRSVQYELELLYESMLKYIIEGR